VNRSNSLLQQVFLDAAIQIRNSKLEIRNKGKNSKLQRVKTGIFLSFDFRICFEFRISCFDIAENHSLPKYVVLNSYLWINFW